MTWTLHITAPTRTATILRSLLQAKLKHPFTQQLAPGGMIRLQLQLTQAPPPDLSDNVEGALAALGERTATIHTASPSHPDLVPGWQAFVTGGMASASVAVIPPWGDPLPGARLNLRIDPGAAFGSGFHVTTRLLLHLLEAYLDQDAIAWSLRGRRVLDLGCGTGILSVLLATLGAQVVALDRAPRALAQARYNAKYNKVLSSIDFSDRDMSSHPGPFDLVVANLGQVLAMTPALAAACGADMILSCLHQGQSQSAQDAARPLVLRQSQSEEDWLALWLSLT